MNATHQLAPSPFRFGRGVAIRTVALAALVLGATLALACRADAATMEGSVSQQALYDLSAEKTASRNLANTAATP